MATIEELSNALVKADAAGDSAGAKILADHIRSLSVEPTQSEPEGLGAIGNTIYGAAKGAADLVQAPAQLALNAVNYVNQKLPNGGSDTLNQTTKQFNEYLGNQERQYQQETPGSTAAGVGRTALNFLPFIFSGGTSAISQAAGAIPKAVQLAKILAQGAGTSMVSQPVNNVVTSADGTNDFMEKKGIQGAVGAAGGLVGAGIGNVLGKVINPSVSATAKAALDEGITPTIGQMIGGGAATVENKLTSLPFVGSVIKNAQRSTTEDFNRAAYNRALNPIGASAKGLPIGNEGVLAVRNTLSDTYNKVLDKTHFKGDPQLGDDLNKLVGMVNNGNIPPSISSQFNSILKNNVLSRMGPNGAMDGKQYKVVESDLIKKAKAFSGSSDPNQRELGSALGEVVNTLKSSLLRSNPEQAPLLAKANEGWANYARIRGAASSTATDKGVFTPAQLAQAVRNQDKSVGKGDFATGQALMQDLTQTGKAVAPTFPDSGTAGRLGEMGVLATLLTQPHLAIPGAVAGAAAAAPYSAIGKKVAAALLARRPNSAPAIADAVRGASPALGAVLPASSIPFFSTQSNEWR